MPQADCKYGNVCLIEFPNFFYYRCTLLWISRSIGEHDAVRFGGYDLFCCGECGIHGHLAASLVQTAGNIFLCSQVQKRHLRPLSIQHIFLFTGHFFHHFSGGVGLQAGKNLPQTVVCVCGDHPVHGSLLTQNLGERSGVNPADSRNIVLNKKVLNAPLAPKIAGDT